MAKLFWAIHLKTLFVSYYVAKRSHVPDLAHAVEGGSESERL